MLVYCSYKVSNVPMRYTKGCQSVADSVAQDNHLSGLIHRATQLKQLNDRLQRCLPEPVRGLCQLANIRGDVAVFICDTQMEASKIRMYGQSILQTIESEFKISVNKLRIKVDM